MTNQVHVCWLAHSKVYHPARYHPVLTGILDGAGVESADAVDCGAVVFTRRFRAMEGTEWVARKLGLRRCLRCPWPKAKPEKMKAHPLTPEDHPCEEGTAVLAPAPGMVVATGPGFVEIDHGRGIHTRFSHIVRRRTLP